jgi:hypothetical protein
MAVRRHIALLALAALCACARSTPAAAPTPTPSVAATAGTASASPAATVTPGRSVTPSPTPTYAGSRTVTDSDSGATVTLTVGETLTVVLPSQYDPPTSSGAAVTRESSTGGYPSGNELHATFRAVSAGRADITSTTDYPCLHTTPRCMIAQRIWVVHVIVR